MDEPGSSPSAREPQLVFWSTDDPNSWEIWINRRLCGHIEPGNGPLWGSFWQVSGEGYLGQRRRPGVGLAPLP